MVPRGDPGWLYGIACCNYGEQPPFALWQHYFNDHRANIVQFIGGCFWLVWRNKAQNYAAGPSNVRVIN